MNNRWFQSSSMTTQQLKRVKFCIQKSKHNEAFQKLAKHNSFIQTFVSQNLELEPLRNHRRRPKKDLKIIHEQAKKLYNALKSPWNYKCNHPHFANLRVDSDFDSLHSKKALITGNDSNRNNASFQFSMVFYMRSTNSSKPWFHQETVIEIVKVSSAQADQENGETESKCSSVTQDRPSKPRKRDHIMSMFSLSRATKQDPSPVPFTKPSIRFMEASSMAPKPCPPKTVPATKSQSDIKDLCALFNDLRGGKTLSDPCVGHIVFDEDTTLAIYPIQAPEPPVNPLKDLLPLTRLLSCSDKRPMNHKLGRGDRYLLAYMTAFSVLQYSKTPWLPDHWSKDDILVMDEETQDFKYRIYLSKPLPHDEASLNGKHEATFPGLRTQTLFSLGIVLIELCLGRTLDMLRDVNDPLDGEGKANILTEWSTATRLLVDVSREAGNRYSDATRRCIYCDFDQRVTSLENDTFKQAVHDGVVLPLEEVAQDFRRE